MENINMGTRSSNRSIGPVIGLIVIIAIILIGGIYFWSMRNSGSSYTSPAAEQSNQYTGASNTAATINTSVPSSYNSVDVEASLNDSDPNRIQTNDL